MVAVMKAYMTGKMIKCSLFPETILLNDFRAG
jgi:hypothetical protein